MKNKTTLIILSFFIFSIGVHAQTSNYQQLDPTISKITQSGIMFVGGENNGTQIIKQSMIHYVLSDNTNKYPLIMLPGLGLSSYIYTATPDNRAGFTSLFANNGYSSYAIDTNNLVISGIDVANIPSKLTVWDQKSIWKTWGFGTDFNQPYYNTQYPIEDIEQLYASFSPQKYSSGMSANPQEVKNIIKLLEKIGPSILMVHSMGGVTGFEVIRQRPDLVKALIVIEPVGSPTDVNDLREHFLTIPYLAVYGDYIKERGQTNRYEACKTTAKILNDNGGNGTVITLTELGITGNTHLMMQDKNNDVIANIIMDWIEQNTN